MMALSAALALAPSLSAQEPDGVEPLVTDRPDFTESPLTVQKGRFQIELGYTFTDSGVEKSDTFGEVLLRVGLAERLELRVGINSYASIDTPGGELNGIEDPALGFKIRLGDGDGGVRPESALLVGTTLPVGSSEVGIDDTQPGAVLALGWAPSEKVGIGSNIGGSYASDGIDRFIEWSGSLAIGRLLTGQVSGYLEYYGFTNSGGGGPDTHFLNTGLTRLFGPDLQLDLRVGYGLNSAADDFLVGAGLAWRYRRGQ